MSDVVDDTVELRFKQRQKMLFPRFAFNRFGRDDVSVDHEGDRLRSACEIDEERTVVHGKCEVETAILPFYSGSMLSLSVLIPTHRRPTVLAECLRRLEAQTIVSQIEVIVVSDGEDDKQSQLFANSSWRMPVRYFEVSKSQQGVARNEALRHASAPIVLFIGDDIFLAPDACERHVQAHASENAGMNAVLGFTTWDPAVGVTPVMTWLETSGWQFGYPSIAKHARGFLPTEIQHRYTYTSHISLPLEQAKKHLFRTDVHLYGWEDIEWGMRLRRSGVRLWYASEAKALHHHKITLEDSLRRM